MTDEDGVVASGLEASSLALDSVLSSLQLLEARMELEPAEPAQGAVRRGLQSN